MTLFNGRPFVQVRLFDLAGSNFSRLHWALIDTGSRPTILPLSMFQEFASAVHIAEASRRAGWHKQDSEVFSIHTVSSSVQAESWIGQIAFQLHDDHVLQQAGYSIIRVPKRQPPPRLNGDPEHLTLGIDLFERQILRLRAEFNHRTRFDLLCRSGTLLRIDPVVEDGKVP